MARKLFSESFLSEGFLGMKAKIVDKPGGDVVREMPRRKGRRCPSGLVTGTAFGDLLLSAAHAAGGAVALADRLGVVYQSIYSWADRGSMPASEWTGATQYCSEIEQVTEGKVTADQLLSFKPRHVSRGKRNA